MMRTQRRLGLSLGLLGSALIGPELACSDPIATECEQLCAELDDCGMLPSPLGLEQARRSAEKDCRARCSLSPNVRKLVQACGVGLDASSAWDDEVDAWCPTGRCSVQAACLRAAFDDLIVGQGRVRLRWSTSAAPESTGTAEVCPIDTQGYRAPLDVEALCEFADMSSQPSTVRVQIESAQEILTIASGPCSDVVGRVFVVEDVPVGVYRTTVMLQWADDAPVTCEKLYGAPVLVKSGEQANAIALISDQSLLIGAQPCETCSGVDDDQDGLIDCEDPDCKPRCVETGVTCLDGLDNDLDTLFDCDDPDCSALVQCGGATESGSDTSGSDSTGP